MHQAGKHASRQLTRDLLVQNRLHCERDDHAATREEGCIAADSTLAACRAGNDLRDGPDAIGDAGLAGGCFGQRALIDAR